MEFGTFDDLFATDEDKAVKGIPVEIGLNAKDEPITLVVADIKHPSSQKIYRKYDKAMESSRHIPKKRTLVWARFLSEAILRDWSGVLDKEGNEIPCTKENKIAALTKYERLFTEVLNAADNSDNFRPEATESAEIDTEKN